MFKMRADEHGFLKEPMQQNAGKRGSPEEGRIHQGQDCCT